MLSLGRIEAENSATAATDSGDLQESLSKKEQLQQQEEKIEETRKSRLVKGQVLRIIQENRLYLVMYKNFREYCKERWGFSDRTAYRYIAFAKVVEILSSFTQILPANEYQARYLSELKTDQEKKSVWQEILETAPNGKVTGNFVKFKVHGSNGKLEEKVDKMVSKWMPNVGDRIQVKRDHVELAGKAGIILEYLSNNQVAIWLDENQWHIISLRDLEPEVNSLGIPTSSNNFDLLKTEKSPWQKLTERIAAEITGKFKDLLASEIGEVMEMVCHCASKEQLMAMYEAMKQAVMDLGEVCEKVGKESTEQSLEEVMATIPLFQHLYG